MDAIAMLEKDHKGAKKVLEEIAKSTGAKRKTLFTALKGELEAHDRLEEEVFYPAVQANPKAAGFALQDKQAHVAVEAALAKLASLPVDDLSWTPTFNAMKQQLLKHVADEETNIFVKIRKLLSTTELTALGEKMKTEKERQLHAV